MKKILFSCVLLVVVLSTIAQKNKSLFKGMYLQWGYNTEWYTKSTIHFNTSVNGIPHNFTIYKAKASDRPDLDAIAKKPIEISIPQFNYRIGFYLNTNKTKAIIIVTFLIFIGCFIYRNIILFLNEFNRSRN